jgi:hypothetical protein
MTDKQIERFRKLLFDEGMAVVDAARELGIPPKQAYYRAKRMGWSAVQRTQTPENWAGAIDRKKIKKLLDKGVTHPAIAETFGVSKQRVQQIAAELGIKRGSGRRKGSA